MCVCAVCVLRVKILEEGSSRVIVHSSLSVSNE